MNAIVISVVAVAAVVFWITLMSLRMRTRERLRLPVGMHSEGRIRSFERFDSCRKAD